MEGAGADSQVFDMSSVQMGGKKRQNKNNKKGGAGVETALAPAVLYTLRRLATPGGKRKQRGGDAFSSQASPVGESTGPLLAVVPVVPPTGVAVVPPSGDMLPKEAVAVATDSGDKPLEGGAKKGKKGKKGPMAEGRMGVYGKVKAWGGDKDDKKDDDNNQDGGKKKRKDNKRKGGDKKEDDKKDDNNNNQDGGKKKRKGGDKKDDNKKDDNKNDNNNNQDGGKKKRNSKKLKGGALDLYAQQLEQISNSLNKLLFN